MRLKLFIIILALFTIKARAQCNFTPLVNNDFNLPGYKTAGQISSAIDTAGHIFVASLGPYGLTVHMHNGTSWTELGTIDSIIPAPMKLAVDKSGTPYVAFRDDHRGDQLSVVKYSGGSWAYVGSAGFSGVAVWSVDIQIDNNNLPVVAFQDQDNASGSVMKFNGSTWNYMGSQFISPNYLTFVSLALDSANVPYVGYSDGTTYPAKATVQMLSGNTWTIVGSQCFSLSQADYIDLKFDKNYNLYIAYSDYYYNQQTTVKKFTGGSWVTVGSPGFTSNLSNYVSLAIDTAGMPYVAAEVYNNTFNPSYYRANVMKYTGTGWINVGPSWNVSEDDAYSTSLLIGKNNLPLLSYVDLSRGQTPTVKKYNGANWDFMGDKGFSKGSTGFDSQSSAVDKNGAYYVAFSDSLNGFKATVMSYANGAWNTVGPPGFTSGTASNICLKFDTLNTPYISFIDGSAASKLSVMKYNGGTWAYVGSSGFSGSSMSANHMAFYNNVPYVVGTNYSASIRDIFTYNGSAWISYSSLTSYSGGGNADAKIAFDNSGMLYLFSRGNYLNVAKYDGSSWQSLAATALGGVYADMALDAAGNIYIISSDVSNSLKITVKKYDGINWSVMGTAAFSNGSNSNSILSLNGSVYIAYSDAGFHSRVAFMRFNGSTWVPGTADTLVTAGPGNYVKLDKDANGRVFLLFKNIEAYAKELNAVGAMTINGPSMICAGQTATLTATGAVSYTWNTSSNGWSITATPPTTSNYFVNANMPNGCVAGAFKTIAVNPGPLFTTTGGGSICAGSIATLTALGANSYTWNGSVVSNSIAVSPSNTTTYTVMSDSAGCSSAHIVLITVVSNPTVMASPGDTAICASQPSINITASGANTYTLIQSIGGIYPLSGNSFTDYLSATTGYTIIGADSSGCTNEAVMTVTVNPRPNVVATASSTLFCPGVTVTLQASGANTYSWTATDFYGTTTLTNTVQSPSLGTVYGLDGTDLNGCENTAYVVVNVDPIPPLSAASETVCVGTSTILSASGAYSYTWSTGANTSSISVMPASTTVYTVSGMYMQGTGLSTCVATQTIAVTVNTTCALVWPGDANSDGQADNLDILELGLHYAATGPARTSISNSWQAYFANTWTGTITNGDNLNHADCNGDGIVDLNDTLAIFNNYALVHSFRPANQTNINSDLTIVPNDSVFQGGQWGSATIYAGSSQNPINNINGLAYALSFNQSLIETDSMLIDYPFSFLNAAGQNLSFRKTDFNSGLLYTATTHTNNINSSGFGAVAIVHFKIRQDLLSDSLLMFAIGQIYKSQANGQLSPLTAGSCTVQVIPSLSSVSLKSIYPLQADISIFPNPTENTTMIYGLKQYQKLELINSIGQTLFNSIIKEEEKNGLSLNLSAFDRGVYLVRISSDNRTVATKKIVKN